MTPQQFKSARKTLGLTQKGMAELLRLSPKTGARTIRAWEAGDTPISGPASLALELHLKLKFPD